MAGPRRSADHVQRDGKSCSFKVQGTATIGLMLDGGEAPSLVKMKATERSPFPFTLDVHLNEANGATTLHQVFNADLNPFIKMMVEKPLGNLFDHIAEKMRVVHG
jgi:hypothetical protein